MSATLRVPVPAGLGPGAVRRPRVGAASRPAALAGCTALFALALVVRARGLHRGLVFPDGYEYLLMARGIAAHLTPTVQLGRGGELFVPSVDAALKPLFPVLVALLSVVSSIRGGAVAVTAVAGAATVTLAAMLSARLTGSRAACAACAAALLLSPTVSFWSGFLGPDPLAPALGLATMLVALQRRGVLAGLLGAACAATRPEWGVLVVAAGFAALVWPDVRPVARTALITGAFSLSGLLAVVRPPLAAPQGGPWLILVTLAVGGAAMAVCTWLTRTRGGALVAVGGTLAGFVAVALSHRGAALRAVTDDEWPLLVLAAAGLVRAAWAGRGRPAALLALAAAMLGATYAYRNPGSERYVAQLLPLVYVGVGWLAAGRLAGEADATARGRAGARSGGEADATAWGRTGPRSGGEADATGRGRAGARSGAAADATAWGRAGARSGAVARLAALATPACAVAGIVIAAVVAPGAPVLAPDAFSTLAAQLARAPAGTLVSAAPDAYGFLLSGRPEQSLRPGARGLILLDAAQRTYNAGLSARGQVVARLTLPQGFERPDGTLDDGPAVLVRGVVTAAKS